MLDSHPSGHDNAQLFLNTHLLTSDGWAKDSALLIHNGRIEAIGEQAITKAEQFSSEQLITESLTGKWILPGIIDLHGDAFEREITPRAGTQFPLALAMAANDANLVAHGITTFFYSITDGFEPGPRSRETVRQLLNTLEEMNNRFACQLRIHLRHEQVNTDDHQELLDWISNGRIHLLSLNDHLPPMDNPKKIARYLAGLKRRVSLPEEETEAFLESRQHRRELGEKQTLELVDFAHKHFVTLASHDDQTMQDIERNRRFNTAIAEFPMCAETARASRDHGAAVLMGSPNLVRGGSHVGAISVKDALEQDLVDILCSDYHYSSLFYAPFVAEKLGLRSLPDAWKLVSENPAKAAGLGDNKGRIAPGYDADLLIVNQLDGLPTSLERTLVMGKEVFKKQSAV